MKSVLDSLIEELEAGTWQVPEAPETPQEAEGQSSPSSAPPPWPPASLDAERRFGQAHAKLFPFIGRKVRTPAGPGTLLQVFSERVTVLLDSELTHCTFFQPAEIEPVSRE
jgi:hypothetical protein